MPQLATEWAWSADNLALTLTLRPGVTFQDGEAMDAEAVRVNLERFRTAPESLRKGELKPVSAISVIDRLHLRISLSAPYAPLVAVLADRAGMMLSPKAIAQRGRDIGSGPVCAGPFKFGERVAQQRIVLERFAGYWDAGRVGLDRITYVPMPDTTVRLVNLQAGQLDLIERMAPSDAQAVQKGAHTRLLTSPSIAYYGLFFNLAHGARADTPLGRDPRVRAAFDKSIDRAALNAVAFDGQFVPNNQVEAPGSRYWDADYPVAPRDLAGAKALLKEALSKDAGVERLTVELLIPASPFGQQLGELVQAMAGEAGFDVKLRAMEANAADAADQRGDYQIATGIWSGRPDPDGNLAIWLASDGFLNWGKYTNPAMDTLLAQARGTTDVAARQADYRKITDIFMRDRPFIVLYHQRWLFGLSDKVSGFAPVPDGLIRPQGISLAQ